MINDTITPAAIRLKHKDGTFAGLFYWKQNKVRLIHKGGTVDYDLAALADEMQSKEVEVQPQG